jgi:hypothetical protein
VNRFDLGSDQALLKIGWEVQPKDGGQLQWRTAQDGGGYGAWSDPATGGGRDLGAVPARYLEYRVLLRDVPGHDVQLKSVTLDTAPVGPSGPTSTPGAAMEAPTVPGEANDYRDGSQGTVMHFVFAGGGAGRCVIRIWNPAGQLCSTAEDNLKTGRQVLDAHIQGFAPGDYGYQLELDYDQGSKVLGPTKHFTILP